MKSIFFVFLMCWLLPFTEGISSKVPRVLEFGILSNKRGYPYMCPNGVIVDAANVKPWIKEVAKIPENNRSVNVTLYDGALSADLMILLTLFSESQIHNIILCNGSGAASRKIFIKDFSSAETAADKEAATATPQ